MSRDIRALGRSHFVAMRHIDLVQSLLYLTYIAVNIPFTEEIETHCV